MWSEADKASQPSGVDKKSVKIKIYKFHKDDGSEGVVKSSQHKFFRVEGEEPEKRVLHAKVQREMLGKKTGKKNKLRFGWVVYKRGVEKNWGEFECEDFIVEGRWGLGIERYWMPDRVWW